MQTDEILKDLFLMQDVKYRDFQRKLIPTADLSQIIGIRTPELRRYAGRLLRDDEYAAFLQDLPHRYFDENQLHAFIVSGLRDFETCVAEVNRFLPYVDNWATCDQMSPGVFRKYPEALLPYIAEWLKSSETYTVRFGIGMLMEHFLDDRFDAVYPEMIAGIRSEAYYVNMMIAWYFATALAKQYEAVIPYIENRRLSAWTHNMAIRKSIESFRVAEEHKAYLRTLKMKTGK